MHSIPGRRVIMALFLIFLLLPIYWLVNMSFKTNSEMMMRRPGIECIRRLPAWPGARCRHWS